MDKSSRKLSFPILARLWHLKSPGHAKQLAKMLASAGLGRVLHDNAFVLHDPHYKFCCAAARNLLVNGHLLLLSGCMQYLGEKQDWSSFCFTSERSAGRRSQFEAPSDALRPYMGRHLFRHLSEASIVADNRNATRSAEGMIDLLTNFRWLRGRGAAHGRGGVVFDFQRALSAFSDGSFACSSYLRRNPGLISGKKRESIVLIHRVVNLTSEHSFGSIEYSDDELAKQIVGLLKQALTQRLI